MKSINDLNDLLGQAQQMQSHMQQLQSEIAKLQVIGESGAGLVRVTMNGAHEVLKVGIDPSLKDQALEVLEDLIAAACNDAARRVEAAHRKKMSEMTGGLGALARNLSG